MHLQASCQFIVRAGEDYSAHATDPDTLVDWDCVEQVNCVLDGILLDTTGQNTIGHNCTVYYCILYYWTPEFGH